MTAPFFRKRKTGAETKEKRKQKNSFLNYGKLSFIKVFS